MKCDICGINNNIEIHHIIPDNNIIKQIPKTIPLCKNCHIKIHLFYRNSKFAIDTKDDYQQCFREYEQEGNKHILKQSLFEYFSMLYNEFKKREVYNFCINEEKI